MSGRGKGGEDWRRKVPDVTEWGFSLPTHICKKRLHDVIEERSLGELSCQWPVTESAGQHPVHHRAKEAFSLSETYDKHVGVDSLAVRKLMRAYVLALHVNLFAIIGGRKQTRRLLTGLTQLYNKFGMRHLSGASSIMLVPSSPDHLQLLRSCLDLSW
ncbi:uncharacterized protein LOC144872636 [Branchiostoma floridae x Branchiostoma japonicum]